MPKFVVARYSGDSFNTVCSNLQKDINQFLDEGYVLIGNLTCAVCIVYDEKQFFLTQTLMRKEINEDE